MDATRFYSMLDINLFYYKQTASKVNIPCDHYRVVIDGAVYIACRDEIGVEGLVPFPAPEVPEHLLPKEEEELPEDEYDENFDGEEVTSDEEA